MHAVFGVQAILINGQFPGPKIECQTDDNLIINVHNSLPEPFLLSWYGQIDLRTNELICSFSKFCPVSKINEDHIVRRHAATNSCYMAASIGKTHCHVWCGSGSFFFFLPTMLYVWSICKKSRRFLFTDIKQWAGIVRECWWLWNDVQI